MKMALFSLSPITGTILLLLLGFIGYKLIAFSRTAVKELRRLVYIRRTLPGPPAHWLVGNALDKPNMITPGLDWYREMATTYRRLFVIWVGWKPIVILSHPDPVRSILTGQTGTVKGPLYRLFRDWLGDGMALTDGAKWKRHRRLITPSFHFNILKSYITKMNQASNIMVANLSKLANTDEPIKLHSTMTSFSSDIILQCAFSYESHCQESESKHVDAIDTLADVILRRFINPFLVMDFFFRMSSLYKPWKDSIRTLHELQEKLISARKEKHKTTDSNLNNFKQPDFLDTLLLAHDSNGEGFDDSAIKDEVNTFIFAGTDTTASALTWFLYSLAKHPDYQKKVQQEVDALFDGRESDDVCCDDLRRVPFVTQCIKESLRMYVMPAPNRTLTEPLVVGNITIPVGTDITIMPYLLHHNPDLWGEDNMEFKPSRFNPENVNGRDPFAFLPFSAGERNCIAQQFALQEIQVAAIRIFTKFTLSVVLDSKPMVRMVTAPEKEILLGVRPRDNNN